MLRTPWRRVYLDKVRRRVWVDGSWYVVYRSEDRYVCSGLSVERLSSIRAEDLPKVLLFKAVAPLNLSNMGAAVYVERGRINIDVYVDRFCRYYAVGVEELEWRLTNMLRGLGYDVKTYEGHGGVGAAMSCRGKLEPYIEGLLEGLEGFRSWVLELHTSRVQEARGILKRMYGVDGRYLAAGRNVSGIARMLVASLTREDIAYLLLESDTVNSHVKHIVFREMGLSSDKSDWGNLTWLYKSLFGHYLHL